MTNPTNNETALNQEKLLQEICVLKEKAAARGNNSTALHIGAVKPTASYDAVVFLLGEGDGINAQDDDGNTPLHLTNSEEFARAVRHLCGQPGGSLKPDLRNKKKQSALHVAYDGDIVNNLLRAKFSANIIDAEGYTPLMRFIERYVGHEPSPYEFKTSWSVDEAWDAPDYPRVAYGLTRLASATKPEFMSVVSQRNETALHMALKLHPDYARSTVRDILARGADPNAMPSGNASPVHNAPNEDLLLVLLSAGGKPDLKDSDGRTPLHMAASPQSARLLIEAGAQVDARDKEGRTPLEYMEQVRGDEAKAVVQYLRGVTGA